MDSNSKSELWFSPYSDARGNKLSEFISANNLFIINEDCGPTFRATRGTSYINITVIGSDLLEDNSSWCLSENESLSDHVMIEFEFCLSTVLRDTSSAPFVIFNANWCRFRKFCLSRMTHIFDTLNSCTNSSCLNTVIEELSFVIHQACLYSIPIKKTSKHNVPWWSIEIGCARKRLNASRRRFQRCKNPTVRELYKNSYLEYRKDYNQMLINAKSESWKKFLLTIDAQNVWKKVYTISWYLRRGDFFSSDQYGFTPHKSTEDDLLRLNEIIKRGKKKHLHSILISLDIKGAFDNAWWPCILNLLKKAEIPINIFSLVADFLNDRVAKMQLGSMSAIRCLERGCLPGSVSGPIFWNIIIHDLLSKLNNLACCEIIAFADDILVCSQGRDLSETFLHAQEALNFASDWLKSFKLEFNLDKTRFMAIEKRNVCYEAFQLYLDGTPLTMVKQMKYLGVLLDTKFSWKQHLSYISEKCDKLQRGLNRIARNTFGINFNVHSLIYKQGIEPFILYGSRVLGEALKRKMNSKYLRRIQRRILLRVICGYRTISYDSVYAISGFPPIDITILHDIAFRENLSASSISNYDCILSPFFIPHPSERNAINIVQFSDKSTEDFPVICYTDGSKIDGRVGFAFVVFRSGVESENFQFRIRDECTVL
ncbi:putative 115 kDa protein in type-1 retrotransposable element R1DM [Trichonephila clavipes]|nr:putative 115 kDa protein in type-1 retrotransposable element R1DM [Trichonephila clavipes]